MDEVFYGCWESSPEIANFMKQKAMTKIADVEDYYIKETLNNAKSVGYNYMMWQRPRRQGHQSQSGHNLPILNIQ